MIKGVNRSIDKHIDTHINRQDCVTLVFHSGTIGASCNGKMSIEGHYNMHAKENSPDHYKNAGFEVVKSLMEQGHFHFNVPNSFVGHLTKYSISAEVHTQNTDHMKEILDLYHFINETKKNTNLYNKYFANSYNK